jgi:hypothetical protein
MHNGGVCKDLDYKVDQMADYVAEMAQRLVIPTSPVSPPFRKFVSQILTSTRLPSTTILLGMNYLARRANMMRVSQKDWKPEDGQVYRMLTIGLLLGSKFLDDNTFQNRSWSEVSGISVKELNTMEMEWLTSLDWLMYVNLDKSDDFKAWLGDWRAWREKKDMQNKATLDRLAPLAPIDTNVQRPRAYQQTYSAYTKSVPRERPQSGSTSALEYYQQAQAAQAQAQAQAQAVQAAWAAHSYPTPQLTPESAPGSGFNTPEYPSATGGGPRFNDWSVYQPYVRGYQQSHGHSAHSAYVAPHVASYQTPIHNYPQHCYGANTWDWNLSDGHSCSCCSSNKQPYAMSHGYVGQQILA